MLIGPLHRLCFISLSTALPCADSALPCERPQWVGSRHPPQSHKRPPSSRLRIVRPRRQRLLVHLVAERLQPLLEPRDRLGEARALRAAARADDRLGPAAAYVVARELIDQAEIASLDRDWKFGSAQSNRSQL